MSIKGVGRLLMEKSILNFHFDYLNPSLMLYGRGFPHQMHIALQKLDKHCWEEKKALL